MKNYEQLHIQEHTHTHTHRVIRMLVVLSAVRYPCKQCACVRFSHVRVSFHVFPCCGLTCVCVCECVREVCVMVVRTNAFTLKHVPVKALCVDLVDAHDSVRVLFVLARSMDADANAGLCIAAPRTHTVTPTHQHIWRRRKLFTSSPSSLSARLRRISRATSSLRCEIEDTYIIWLIVFK